jgi:hypothetical protein
MPEVKPPPESSEVSRWAFEVLRQQQDYIRLLEERLEALEKKLDNS